MKKNILTIMFTVLISYGAHPEDTASCNTDEPRYHVKVYVASEGTINEKHIGKKVKIYAGPSDDSILLDTFIVTKDGSDYASFYFSFNRDKNVYGSGLIASTERKGDFYKVCYKGKDVWLKKGGVVVVYNIQEYFKEIGTAFEILKDRNTPFYKTPEGEEVEISQFKEKLPPVYKVDEIYGEVKEVKEINGKLWLMLRMSPDSFLGAISATKRRENPFEPFSVWLKPYDDQGRIDGWNFPHNDVFFYKTNEQ